MIFCTNDAKHDLCGILHVTGDEKQQNSVEL